MRFVLPFAIACTSPSAPEDPASGAPVPEDGPALEYVLGVDPSGAPILGGSHGVVRFDEDRDAYGYYNQPVAIHPELIGEALRYDPGLTEGETDWDVFPSSWWPMTSNGIAERWVDADEPSPAEKYDALVYPGQERTIAAVEHWYYGEIEQPASERPPKHRHEEVVVAGPTTEWEMTQHGVYQPLVHPDGWWGHCNGWAAYASAEGLGAPTRGVSVRLDPSGDVEECLEEASDCVAFRRGDIEALMSEVWFADSATFGGLRCDTPAEEIERDAYGRAIDPACRDLNPGTLHVVVTQLLGRGAEHLATGERLRLPVVIDHSWDWQVWNFPLIAFQIREAERVDEATATALVGGEEGYLWNDAAASWVRISMTYWMHSDDVDRNDLLLDADRRDVRPYAVPLHYLLELDANDFILGGEWIEAPAAVFPDSRELHPDFLWIPVDHQSADERPNDTDGSSDNPWIAYRQVRQLLACANDPATCAPPDPVVPDPLDDEEAAGCGCGGSSRGPWVLAFAAVLLLGAWRRGRARGGAGVG